MQTTTLYLVRHGETDYNRKRIVQGRRINSSLNATGRAQAAALGRRLAGVPIDAIYSSTLRRAEETASYIAANHDGVALYRLQDLEEMSWGVYEGEPVSSRVETALHEMHQQWKRGDYGTRVEGGESILDVQTRGLRAIRHIVERHSGQTVVVVTHGRFLRVLLATILDEYGLERMDEVHHANTCVNHLEYTAAGFAAHLLNCTLHLDEVEEIMVE
ncbi:MAG TPA: histidine phosphatase family protein [Rhodothermales bacterium]|nr:histidine phosphatase family protein [Rhodothermales bacterium]